MIQNGDEATTLGYAFRPVQPTLALLLSFLAGATPVIGAPPLADRIGHTDPARYVRSRSHGGPGDMACMTLIGPQVLPFLNFVHRCQITAPRGGVGLHAHHRSEEMFVIFDGEAEFTLDGRASILAGPVAVPLRLGQSHAILNLSPRPVEFLNVNVATVDGQYDAQDLDPSRVTVEREPIPASSVVRLDRALLEPRRQLHGGRGTVRYRRALDAAAFRGNWSHVDHLVVPAGASDGPHRHPEVAEVYFVMSGAGEVRVGEETSAVRAGDAVPIFAGEAHSVTAAGARDLELMILGIALRKGAPDAPARE